jgi:alpha-glucosidase
MPGPAWWQRGAIYQIYPRSFADGNGDGIGDLPGIEAHVDHLADLGVEAIWLSPFYPSPMADFGYDVADYCDVDPVFGTLADFDRLLETCHARAIKVVIDWVPNHTSDQHPWFVASRSSREDPKRDWYVWRDPAPDGGPPNDWMSDFGAVGGAWELDETTGQYYLHSFMREQPDLNWDNPEVEAAMHETLRFWLDRGVDGFRIDVTHKLGKDPELRDDDGKRTHSQDWETTHARVRGIRRVIDSYDDRMIVGEVYLLDLERLIAYVNSGDELHLAHNFVFLNLPWSAAAFRESIDRFEALSTETAWPAWFLSNHDHPRVASRFDEHGLGQARARAVLLMLYALRGTPFVYQGEELGLPDAEIPPDRIVDVDGRDPERAPIPWTATPDGGWTDPWLPLTSEAERFSVEHQAGDPHSTLALTRRLARLRRDSPVLQTGTQTMVDAGADLLAWTREGDGERLLAVVNFAAHERPLAAAGAELVLSTDAGRGDGPVDRLAAGEAVVLRLPPAVPS